MGVPEAFQPCIAGKRKSGKIIFFHLSVHLSIISVFHVSRSGCVALFRRTWNFGRFRTDYRQKAKDAVKKRIITENGSGLLRS